MELVSDGIIYYYSSFAVYSLWGLPRWNSDKESACNAGDAEDKSLIPRSGRSPGVGNGNPLQYSCLENSTEEPCGLQSMGFQRKGHNRATEQSLGC